MDDSKEKDSNEKIVANENNNCSNSNNTEKDKIKNYHFLYKQQSIIEDIQETHVLRAIEKKLGTNHFCLLTYKLEPIIERIGLLGDYSFLNVAYLNAQGTKEHLTFFVKHFPKIEALAEFAQKIGAFKKEVFVYKLFKEFNKEEVSLINNVIPQCYATSYNEYLILDNLFNEGYKSSDKHTTLDYDTVLIVLQSIAQLHASSIIFENKANKKLQDLYSNDLEESFFSKANQQGVEASVKCIIDEIELFDQPKTLKSGRNFVDVAEEVCYKIYDLVKPSEKYKNVLSHGDIWATNILLKHDTKTKKPIACKLVDFQCGRYVPPAQDVLSFLYLTTSKEFRKKYMYEVLGMYYSYLEKNVKHFGFDINQILPFENFMQSCEELKVFAIVLAAIYFPLILINNNEIEEYFSNKELNEKALFDNRIHLVKAHKDKDAFYEHRIQESLDDLKAFCENYKS